MNIKLDKRKVTASIIEIALPASKSISNRLLMIQKQCNKTFEIRNLSKAGDTQVLLKSLNDTKSDWNLIDAGTPLRFLTVYGAAMGYTGIIDGNDSLKRRPILPLIQSLSLEKDIEWLGEKGFVPFIFKKRVKKKRFLMDAEKSSQFISALLLSTPSLGGEIEIEILNKNIPSKPYLDMTINLMKEFGAEVFVDNNVIRARVLQYSCPMSEVDCESDWTAASYFYALSAVSGQGFLLKGLKEISLQGDCVLVDVFNQLGVESKFVEAGLLISKSEKVLSNSLKFNFINQPDLAPAVIVCCALLNANATFMGFETLKYKESDRILSLRKELLKIGVQLKLKGDKLVLLGSVERPTKTIDSYNDHRMAMAMASLSCLFSIEIKDKNVVNKSFPGFWDELLEV